MIVSHLVALRLHRGQFRRRRWRRLAFGHPAARNFLSLLGDDGRGFLVLYSNLLIVLFRVRSKFGRLGNLKADPILEVFTESRGGVVLSFSVTIVRGGLVRNDLPEQVVLDQVLEWRGQARRVC